MDFVLYLNPISSCVCGYVSEECRPKRKANQEAILIPITPRPKLGLMIASFCVQAGVSVASPV